MEPEPAVGDGYLVARARDGYLDAYEMLVQRHSAVAYRARCGCAVTTTAASTATALMVVDVLGRGSGSGGLGPGAACASVTSGDLAGPIGGRQGQGREQAADFVDGERDQFVIMKIRRWLSTGIGALFESGWR
jgi:hypothetical protein